MAIKNYIKMEAGVKMAGKRFISKDDKGLERNSIAQGTRIFVDTRTGVQYLFVYSGYAGGLTILVDKDGSPLLDEEHVN